MISIRKTLGAACLVALSQGAMASDVGVSISIGDPNFYGRLDLGNAPRPVLMYPQPVVIQPPAYRVQPAPVYLRVPPGHARDWRRYCGRYEACGVPVYFVQDNWYRNVYAPRYRAEYGHERYDDRYDRRPEWRDERFDGGGRGHGHDHGHGHGHGHGRD